MKCAQTDSEGRNAARLSTRSAAAAGVSTECKRSVGETSEEEVDHVHGVCWKVAVADDNRRNEGRSAFACNHFIQTRPQP